MKDIIFGIFFGSIALGTAAAIMLAGVVVIYAVKKTIDADRKARKDREEGWE